MQGKSALGSVTIVSAVVVIVVQLAQLAGYTLSPDDQATITNLINSGFLVVSTVVSMAAGGAAIWGRLRAEKPVTSVLPKPQG